MSAKWWTLSAAATGLFAVGVWLTKAALDTVPAAGHVNGPGFCAVLAFMAFVGFAIAAAADAA